MRACQRYKYHRNDLSRFHFPCLGFFDQQQLLGQEPATDRDDHSSPAAQLSDQIGWYVTRRSGHHDCIEGGMLSPAVIPIAQAGRDVVKAQQLQPRRGFFCQWLDYFNAVNAFYQPISSALKGTSCPSAKQIIMATLKSAALMLKARAK